MDIKVFNVRVDETRYLVQHKLWECKCGLSGSVCNSKQKWNNGECWCKCKELNDWISCKGDSMGNPGTCYRECNKAFKINKYLDIKNCLCKKCWFGKLIYEDEILYTTDMSLVDKKSNNWKK